MDDLIKAMAKQIKRKGTDSLPFKDILASIMTERRLTVKQVAALASVNASVVQNWLSGQNPHNLQAVNQLAEKLGIPFKKLLLGQDEKLDSNTQLSQLYDEQDFFDGLARIKIQRLIPKKKE